MHDDLRAGIDDSPDKTIRFKSQVEKGARSFLPMNCVGLGEGRALVTKNSLKVSFGRVPNAELALLPA
jgi:hypothetical protein